MNRPLVAPSLCSVPLFCLTLLYPFFSCVSSSSLTFFLSFLLKHGVHSSQTALPAHLSRSLKETINYDDHSVLKEGPRTQATYECIYCGQLKETAGSGGPGECAVVSCPLFLSALPPTPSLFGCLLVCLSICRHSCLHSHSYSHCHSTS